jgi:hypothetical protein
MAIRVLSRLLLDPDSLSCLSIYETRRTFNWALENLLSQKIMTVEAWMQTAFHLCKQRWDASVDWLEAQPVPKILLMIEIVNQHVKAQEAEMKKAGKKR